MRVFVVAFFAVLAAASIPATGFAATLSPSPGAARANDNRLAAGRVVGTELHVALEARSVMWHPDGADGAGIPMQAFAEAGKTAQIPGPLIRVPLGTIVVASVRNAIPGTTLTLHNLVNRPTFTDHPVRVAFGATRVVRFRAGASGTFLYWAETTGKPFGDRYGVDSQLHGAMIVDPPGTQAAPNDRIFVIGQWINVRDKRGKPNFDYELDTINGRAWPHTERLSYAKDATVRWRWINASAGTHPLHLHGFFFRVDSRGDGLADTVYARGGERDSEVTELVAPGSTFAMTWHADRPGSWLFHCHLAYHVMGHMPIDAMLAGKSTISDEAYENDYVRRAGMGGLVLGVTVRAPHAWKVAAVPAAQRVRLTVEPAPGDRADAPWFRYVVGGVANAPIVLTRGVPSAIDVTNDLREPTAVHWHGMELQDSYYDGVMGFSGAAGRVAPMIEPGQTFEARMTPRRAGTFIYHTHMDDVWQLRGGLAAPLIVLEPGQTYDPNTDHAFTITTTHALNDALNIFVNGTSAPPPITCRVGVRQRIRLINMTTFWTNATVSLIAANRALQWTPLATDGMELPAAREQSQTAVTTVTIGETRDFAFTPTTPGDLQLQFLPDPSVPHIVNVPIHVISAASVAATSP